MLNSLVEIFASFERHDVRYLVIGGIAAVLHGVPRATFDVDILIESSPENAASLLAALEETGLGTARLTNAQEILANEITIFEDRVRIDVQTSTPGIEFEDAWRRKDTMTFQSQGFFGVCLEDLIASKKAAGRPVDLEDVRLLTQGEEE